MHPLIARFLDLPTAIATLEKAESDSTLDADESALLAASIASPKSREAVLKAKGKQKASAEAEQHLIVLATRAATKRLSVDPKLGPRMTSARAALEKEGASAEEAEGLIAQAVLEEAFGYAEDPGAFDADYLAETFDSLAHLGAITQDTIDTWLEDFAKQGNADERALRLSVAEAVLESAWSDGPQPITPEHLDEALEKLGDLVAESDFTKATQTVELLLTFLLSKHVVGRERAERLSHLAKTASTGGADPFEDEAQDEDDADDEPIN